MLLLMISNYAHADGSNVFASMETLAEDCRMSVRQVIRLFKELEKSGELIVQRSRGGKPHLYSINIDEDSDKLSGLKRKRAKNAPQASRDGVSEMAQTNHDNLSEFNPDKSGDQTLTNQGANPDKSGTQTLTNRVPHNIKDLNNNPLNDKNETEDENYLLLEFEQSKLLRETICKAQGKKGRVPIVTFDEWQAIKLAFEFWRTTFNKNGSARLNIDRGRAVLDRLRPPVNYSIEDIKKAIEGCKVSPYHSGKNGDSGGKVFDELELICRDDAHLERFIGYYDAHRANGSGNGKHNRGPQANGNGANVQRANEIIADSERFERPPGI